MQNASCEQPHLNIHRIKRHRKSKRIQINKIKLSKLTFERLLNIIRIFYSTFRCNRWLLNRYDTDWAWSYDPICSDWNVRIYTLPIFVSVEISAMILRELRIPKDVIRGNDVRLECFFKLDPNDELYSVKWYKDGNEIYRYLPKEKPPTTALAFSGGIVDVSDFTTHTNMDSTKLIKKILIKLNMHCAGQ